MGISQRAMKNVYDKYMDESERGWVSFEMGNEWKLKCN